MTMLCLVYSISCCFMVALGVRFRILGLYGSVF